MTDDSDAGVWLCVGEVARRWKLSSDAVRQRVRRGTLSGMRGNDGRVKIWVANGSDASTDRDQSVVQPRQSVVRPRQSVDASADDRSSDRSDDRSIDRRTGDTDRLIAHLEQQLIDQDSRRLAELERLTAQFNLERALLVERIDAAELRAERVEARLDRALDHLMKHQQSSGERSASWPWFWPWR